MPLQSLLPANRFTLLGGPTAGALDDESKVNQLKFGVDFEDSDQWASVTGLPEEGAVLIRPDGHIAARFDAVDSAAVESVMDEILLRSS